MHLLYGPHKFRPPKLNKCIGWAAVPFLDFWTPLPDDGHNGNIKPFVLSSEMILHSTMAPSSSIEFHGERLVNVNKKAISTLIIDRFNTEINSWTLIQWLIKCGRRSRRRGTEFPRSYTENWTWRTRWMIMFKRRIGKYDSQSCPSKPWILNLWCIETIICPSIFPTVTLNKKPN